MNNCAESGKLPKVWRRDQVLTFLKPGTFQKNDPLESAIDSHFTPQQAGFGVGKSCTFQVLSLIQHIEKEWLEERKVTGTFRDMTSGSDI